MKPLTSALLVLSLLVPIAVQAADPGITVTGRGEVRLAPDEAVLRFAVVSLEPELAAAKAANDRVMRDALDRVRALGVSEDRIRTDRLQVEPVSQARRATEIDAYRVTTSVMVAVGKLDRLDAVVAAVLEAGVNRIDELSFRRTDYRIQRDRALRLALEAARDKADLMAETLDREIGAPLSIQEGLRRTAPSPSNVSRTFGGAETSEDGPLAPGLISISASVTVTFAMNEG